MSTTTDWKAMTTALYTPEYRQSIVQFTDTPPGVISYHESRPNGRGISYIVVSIILVLLSTAVVGVRFYARTALTRALGWDDCLWFTHGIWWPPWLMTWNQGPFWPLSYVMRARTDGGDHLHWRAQVFTYIWTGATINSQCFCNPSSWHDRLTQRTGALLGLGIHGWNNYLTVADKEEYAKVWKSSPWRRHRILILPCFWIELALMDLTCFFRWTGYQLRLTLPVSLWSKCRFWSCIFEHSRKKESFELSCGPSWS